MAIPADAPVRLLDRYALHGEIASGGMASVHFGRLIGPGGFSRTVAIKRMHQAFARDQQFVEMFLAEARIAARVRHPNVVPTLDVVAHDGEAFLIMEFVLGESLAGLLRACHQRHEQVPLPIASAILFGALQGLHAAHEVRGDDGQPLGLVHRDVSPQNVIVGVDGAPRVLDFGIAKASSAGSDATRHGILKGKVGYLAPEQIRGGSIDRRVDVFAASVVLWEVLTGERLFSGNSPEHNLMLVLEQQISAPGASRTDIPPALDRVVLRGLSRDPEARFQTARDLALALEEAVAPASPARVGEWVQQVAGPSVALRAEQLARMDSTKASAASCDELSAELAPPAASSSTAELPTAVHGPPRPGIPARSRTRWLAWGVAAVVSVGAAAGLIALRGKGPPGACTLSSIQHLESGAAAHHTCARSVDAAIWCWGDNQKAQLGAGNTDAAQGAVLTRTHAAPRELGVGNVHSCAVLDDGHAECWGKGLVPKPTRVIGIGEAVGIAPGGMHTCALRRDLTVDCWGDNDAGQLGSTARDAALAVRVQALEGVAALDSGTSHSCAATRSGAVYCWGSNAFGQLGTGATDHDPHPVPVLIEGLPAVAGVSAGDKTSFAWTADGKAFGWGFTIKRPLPVALDDIVMIDAGGRQNCAVRRDHSVWCWGFNDAGQLGQGAPDDAADPVRVSGLPPAREVAVGDRHACALSDAGEAWCWGSNEHGELGAGPPDQTAHPAPQRVRPAVCK